MTGQKSTSKRGPKKPLGSKSRTKRISDAAECSFIESLREHGQLHEGAGPLPPGTTHVLRKKRAKGRVKAKIERKRFSYL